MTMQEYRGLSNQEVNERIKLGQTNQSELNKTKSYQRIFYDNIFTLFNFINIVLTTLVFFTGSYKNLLFMGVVIFNALIGIVQEIRAKKTLDRINLIVASKVKAIRNGEVVLLNVDDVVLNDYLLLKTGNQIIADGKVIDGHIEVDESLLTGESDVVKKWENDELFSGSFVTSGEAIVEVNKVGKDCYASKISSSARVYSKYPSELRDTLNQIIKYIGIAIIPIGIIIFLKDTFILNMNFTETILTLSAALIGMVPEGLVVLTSIALAVGVVNLAKHKTLVQELYCIETLARVDTLCLDKTGTLTEGRMEVSKYHEIVKADEKMIIGNLVNALNDDNPSINAIRLAYDELANFESENIVPFSSERKYSGVNYKQASYGFGAYEFVFKQIDQAIKDAINEYAKNGQRVLCLFKCQKISETSIDNPELLGLIILVDKVRKSAKKTLEFFNDQGVDIKIISGDNPLTVSEVAMRCGVKNYQKYIDATTLSDEDINNAVRDYAIFGRVSPKQKKLMVQALKSAGHTVGMSGDGVNDVLAFKEADVSIAMASGSDVAKNSANLVLLDSNFDALPHVLNEGRRVINNIQRVATLFLTKTIYSCALAIITVLLPFDYPFVPIHLTFVSSLTIGIPSFFIALEANHNRVKGRFRDNIIRISLPAALGAVISLIYIFVSSKINGFGMEVINCLGVIALCTCGLTVLFKVCLPFSKLRIVIYLSMLIAVLIGYFFAYGIISITPLDLTIYYLQLIIILLIIVVTFMIFNKIFEGRNK